MDEIKKYLKWLEKNSYSKSTITTYKSILNKYVDKNLTIIKKKIKSYTNPNTQWTHYNVICSYMKFKKDKRLDSLKEMRLKPINQQYMPVFSKNYLDKKTKNWLFDERKIVIRMLFYTGIRVSELSNLQYINKNLLLVKSGKGNKDREIFHNNEISEVFFEDLKKLKKWSSRGRSSKNEFISTKTIRLWVKEILGEEYTPHSIRRSFVTHMIKNGADIKMISRQVGHSKIETTYKYLHYSRQENQNIYKKFMLKNEGK